MASVSFTDAIGSASLQSGPDGLSRFASWTPMGGVEADRAHALGNGALYAFVFGSRADVSFAVTHIPAASLDVVTRLTRHLQSGGIVTVTTTDLASRTYATCQMVDGSPPTIELSDRKRLTYQLSLTLRNVAPTPLDMLCVYR